MTRTIYKTCVPCAELILHNAIALDGRATPAYECSQCGRIATRQGVFRMKACILCRSIMQLKSGQIVCSFCRDCDPTEAAAADRDQTDRNGVHHR